MSSVRYNGSPLPVGKRGEQMREPEEVAAMLALHATGRAAARAPVAAKAAPTGAGADLRS
jgi:hypothetical protein